MSRADHYRTTTESMFDALDELCSDMSDTDWSTQSLCPDWDNKAVIAHVAGVEDVLTGWAPSADTPPPFGKLAAFTEAARSMDTDELHRRCREIWAARRDDLAGLTDEALDTPAVNPKGVGPYSAFLQVRVFDMWVHERDVSIPIGRSTDDTGPAAEMALDEVQSAIGYIVGKKIGMTDGQSITFHVTGPVERDLRVAVDGRAGLVDVLPSPDVAVTADLVTFVLLACGRLDPQEPIDAGRITWTGDAEWGERAARNLAYTM